MNKAEALKEAAIKFRDSEKSADDYLQFSVAVHIALRQGSGLIWEQVDEIFREVIPETPVAPNYTAQVENLATNRVDPDIMNFCTKYKITDLEDLAQCVGEMISAMSDYCRDLSYEDRKPYREIKHSFLKLMYKEGVAKNLFKRISKSPLGGPGRTDVLLEMQIGNKIFHIPDRNQDFVDIETLELHPQIYVRPPIKPFTPTFRQHMDVLKRMDELVAYAQLQF